MAKYPYIVNKDGVWYPAGAEVPEGANSNDNKETKETDFSIDEKVIGKIKDDVIEITDEEVINENQFTKTEINRMSTADLKELAKLNGIDEGLNGAEIKKALIEKFEL